MGNDISKDDAAKMLALSRFSANEKKAVQNLFIKLAGKDKKQLTDGSLQKYLGDMFPTLLTTRLFQEMAHFRMSLPIQKPQSCVSEQNFYGALAYLLCGDADQCAYMVRHLASTHPSKQLTASQLYQFVKKILIAYISVLSKARRTDISKVWGTQCSFSDAEIEMLTHLALADLFHPDKKRDQGSGSINTIPEESYSNDDLVRWIGYSQLFANAFSCVFKQAFPVCETPDHQALKAIGSRSLVNRLEVFFTRISFFQTLWEFLYIKKTTHGLQRTLLPMFVGKTTGSDYTDLLSPLGVIAVNQSVPYKLREKWTLLFDSRKQGESFTNLLRNVRNLKNIVIVVRDTEGHVFGGFTTAVWANHAAFQGSIDNFLFSLHPYMRIYRPTGLNTNYFYFNTGQETFPNGMGMGGQLNYFGLWLDCEYGIGHSMAKPLSTTYHNPTLSKHAEFTYNDLEVWKCSNIQEDIEEEEAKAEQRGTTSILDSDPGAKAILDMIGKGNLSDGLRESDPTASNPEETHPPVL